MKDTWSIDALQDTWMLASQLHDGQKYGGQKQGQQIEYINHIGSVAFEVIHAIGHTEGMDAQLAIHCALLHDSIEDTGLSHEAIKSQFGQQVADGVAALSKNESLGSKEGMMLDSLRRIKMQPREVWAVKMADRISNLYAPPFYWDNDKKINYLTEAKLIHRELQEGNAYLAERLMMKIEAYSRYIDRKRDM